MAPPSLHFNSEMQYNRRNGIMPREEETAVPAEHGKKMIEIKIRFFTDAIAPEGQVVPRQGWTCGVALVTPNSLHGITSLNHPIVFNTWSEMNVAIEKALIEANVKLRPYGRMQKYIIAE